MHDHYFCRKMLAIVMKDVRRHVSIDLIKEAWVYKYTGMNSAEFQIPSVKFYWYGRAHCAYEARYQAWFAYMKEHVPGYDA